MDRSNPTRRKLSAAEIADGDAVKELQVWHKYFIPEDFPKELCTVSFSRSSGPGGQNVNKYLYTAMNVVTNKIEYKGNHTDERVGNRAEA
jgi:protein subunit release factor B